MLVKKLYKYSRESGGITVSTIEPCCCYEILFRLIADEGKVLTKSGIDFTSSIDVENTDGWYEVEVGEAVGIDEPKELFHIESEE